MFHLAPDMTCAGTDSSAKQSRGSLLLNVDIAALLKHQFISHLLNVPSQGGQTHAPDDPIDYKWNLGSCFWPHESHPGQHFSPGLSHNPQENKDIERLWKNKRRLEVKTKI